MKKKYYITTPLYYVNAKPHIGHAYTTVAADAAARFKRLMGHDVFFLTGTDEHGQKVAKAAAEAGLAPQEFTDRISATFRDLWKTLGITHDYFIRTTEAKHKESVKAVWLELQKRGELYQTEYTAWYCVNCERFLTEFEVNQQGSPICPDCKRPTDQKLSESNYFFKMSKHQAWLIEHLKKNPGSVLPESRRNEVLGFLNTEKLEDLCVSRPKARLSWGIECPLDPNYVTYVWFDALINYISACGYPKLDGRWPADVHLVGKDILRHHAVIWPIILKALGLDTARLVFAHGWWVQDKAKMSKSLGNVVDPVQVMADFGRDAFRYFLLREVPFGQDGTFSQEAITLRYNMDLANNLGNLLYRTLTMLEKYHGGAIKAGGASKADHELRQKTKGLAGRMETAIDRLQFHEALTEAWAVVDAANRYIEQSAPWSLAKAKKDAELLTVMVSLCEALRIVAQAAWPFIPETAAKIWAQLGLEEDKLVSDSFQKIDWDYFKADTQTRKGDPLFPRRET